MKTKKHTVADENKTGSIKLGLFNGEKYIADGYDFDEDNEEIAILFYNSTTRSEDAVSVYDNG